jgi:esterase/lipase superfamily enzyme
MLVFGHAGKPLLVFPSSEGRFYDWENFGMVTEIAGFIERGLVQVFCIDGIDWESWYAPIAAVDKGRRANDYDWAIVHDVVPFIKRTAGQSTGIFTHGCSFGGYHAVNFYLKHPDIFDGCLSLSGNYSIDFTVGGFYDGDVYFHDPLKYLPNLEDEWFLHQLRCGLAMIVCGQGAWEEWLGEAHQLSSLLHAKKIPHLFDLWGFDVAHDWPWWKKQIVHHLGKLERAGLLSADRRLQQNDVVRYLESFPVA